jgi:hypothetical protein
MASPLDRARRRALHALMAMLLALPLAGCLEGAVSHRGFDFTDATPRWPFPDNAFDLLSRSEVISVNQMANGVAQRVSVRVGADGRQAIIIRPAPRPGHDSPADIVMPVRYFALPDQPSLLAIRFGAAALAQTNTTPAEYADAQFYVFVERTADILQVLPFNRGNIEAWRPATDADRQLREQVLRLRPDGRGASGTFAVENEEQLALALRVASRLPTTQRATLRIRDAAVAPRPQTAAPVAPPAADVPTRWQFGQSRDPVTRVVTHYANLRSDTPVRDARPMFQIRCKGRRLEFLFVNGGTPLRNELSQGRVRAALMEINFDDRSVQRLIWPLSDRQVGLAIDPHELSGLVAVAGMFDREVQSSVTNWNATWLLNTMAAAQTVVLRVWDPLHNDHVLRFSPRVSLAEVRRNLSDCVR